jgi:GNAT superfamily N-acetyltransferase
MSHANAPHLPAPASAPPAAQTTGPTPGPTSGVTIRRLQAHDWPAYRALRLRSLEDAPYAFGSSLALEASWRPELWMARLTAAASSGRDCPLVAEAEAAGPDPAEDTALGLVYAKCDADDTAIVNVFQMWVAPQARGRGVAAALLHASIAWARSIGARCVRLGVVGGNDAAARLYRRIGFRDVGAPAPLRPGSEALEQTMQLDLDLDLDADADAGAGTAP